MCQAHTIVYLMNCLSLVHSAGTACWPIPFKFYREAAASQPASHSNRIARYFLGGASGEILKLIIGRVMAAAAALNSNRNFVECACQRERIYLLWASSSSSSSPNACVCVLSTLRLGRCVFRNLYNKKITVREGAAGLGACGHRKVPHICANVA